MSAARNKNLSKDQENVLFHGATEAPYTGEYLYHSKDGVYQCANCHAPLFDSSHKYESHCGWPSFDNTILDSVTYVQDYSHGMTRTEVICRKCGGHLGHVFDDGPKETTGQRYCINSLSLGFTEKTKKNSQ